MDFIDTSIIPEGRTRKSHGGEEQHNSYEVNWSSSQKGKGGKGEIGVGKSSLQSRECLWRGHRRAEHLLRVSIDFLDRLQESTDLIKVALRDSVGVQDAA